MLTVWQIPQRKWQQHWLVVQECRKSMYLMLFVSEQ